MLGYLKIFGVKGLRRLVFANIPADLADWLDYTAVVVLLVYIFDGGPWTLALFALAMSVPYVIIGPLAGALVDRINLRWVLIASNLGRGLVTLAFIFAPGIEAVLVLVFLRASVDSAFTPARQAAVQHLTDAENRQPANGLIHGINQTSKVVGPALGGALLLLLSVNAIFVLNAVLSLSAALILAGLVVPERDRDGDAKTPFWKEAPEGIMAFFRNRLMMITLLFAAAGYFSIFLYDTLIALLNRDFGFDETVFGVSIALAGLGGIAGALIAGTLKFATGPFRVIGLGAVVSGPIAALLGLAAILNFPISVLVFLAGALLLGGAVAFILVPYRTIVQNETPPEHVAKAFAAGEAVIVTVMLTAPFLGAAIASWLGTGMPFLLGGAVMFLLGLAAFSIRPDKTSATKVSDDKLDKEQEESTGESPLAKD